MKEIAWSGQNKIFKVSGSFSRGRPRNTWNKVTSKVTKDLAKDINA